MEKGNKNKNNNEPIIKQAIVDFKKIMEAANITAKDSLAKELPEKFESLLNEELNKLKNKESVNESIEDKKEEPVNGKEKTDKKEEPVNGKEKTNENIDMREMSINDVEEAFDTANNNDDFNVDSEETIDFSDIERELAQMGELSDENEETLSTTEEPEIEEAVSDPYAMLKKVYDEFGKYISNMENNKIKEELGTTFDTQMKEMYGEAYKESLGDDKCNELLETFIAHKKGEPYGEKNTSINEEGEIPDNLPKAEKKPEEEQEQIQEELGDDKVENELEKKSDDEIEESHGSSLSQNKTVAANVLPRPEYADYKKSKYRYAIQKENYEKKISGLINDNKKVTKKFNDTTKKLNENLSIVGNYQSALEKYREQLNEMAVFNTNLASVNNLLLNEELALTNDDVTNIINKFKNSKSIQESEEIFGNILTEMKQSKKTITENVENVVNNNVIEPSSKQKIDEVVEKTAYQNNEHISKIKDIMKKVDKRK